MDKGMNDKEEIKRLRQILWDIYSAAGEDTEGITEAAPPDVYTPDIPELALAAVLELRHDYNAALEEIPD